MWRHCRNVYTDICKGQSLWRYSCFKSSTCNCALSELLPHFGFILQSLEGNHMLLSFQSFEITRKGFAEILYWCVSIILRQTKDKFRIYEPFVALWIEDQVFRTNWTLDCLFVSFVQLCPLNRGHYKNCYSSRRPAAFIPDWSCCIQYNLSFLRFLAFLIPFYFTVLQ